MKKLLQLYNESPTIDEWTKDNEPDDNLIYKGGFATQSQKFSAISCLMGLELPRVVSHHTSKSVKLPVAGYLFERPYDLQVLELVRDNFYDLNCTIMSNHEMEMNLKDIYEQVSREWLEEERSRALKYVGKLPFEVPGVSKDMRDNCIKDYRTIAEDKGYGWYSTDWSSGKIIEYEGEFFKAETAFWEGNPGTPINFYEGVPAKDFTFTGDYTKVARVLQLVLSSGVVNKAYKAFDK